MDKKISKNNMQNVGLLVTRLSRHECVRHPRLPMNIRRLPGPPVRHMLDMIFLKNVQSDNMDRQNVGAQCTLLLSIDR